MLFVWIDLGVVWVDSLGQVVDLGLAKSWRLAYFPRQPARYVLELSPGRLEDFRIGDRLDFEDVSSSEL